MLNQFAVEFPTLPVNQCFFPPHPILEGMLRPSFVSPCRKEGPPSIWDTHGISGNVFANPDASSSAPYPQELNQWNSSTEEPLHTSTAERSERPEQNQDLRCQSGPSAKNSVIFSGGDSSKNYGADQQRLQISDLHFDKFPTPATFACWKIRFKTEVCTCSKFPTEAMQWIKEVELVDSVDELRSSSSTRGISMPNFEVLDARIASALNKIIHNSHFKRRISLEEQKAQKQDRFLRGRQIAYLICDYFRVTGSHDSVENYADLFTTGLRSDDIQEFDSKWDGILLSMTKIPHDDILEGLYKLRIRESEKLKTVLELYDLAASTEWGRPLAFDVGTHHHAFVDQFVVLYGSLAEQARRWVMSSFTCAGDSWISTNESCRTWCTRLLGLALAWRDTSRWCPAALVLCNRKGSAGRQHNLCLSRWPRSVWRNWVLRKKNEHWSPGWDVGAVQTTMPVVSEA